MGKVLSGDYSGCSVRANKKSLKIEYISTSPLNKHNIINVIKANGNQVRVQYVNNNSEKENVLELKDIEYQVLMDVLAEQAGQDIKVLRPTPKPVSKLTQFNKAKTKKCIKCKEDKPIESFPDSTARKCNKCREEDAKRAEDFRLKYEAELAEALKYGKICGGGFCIPKGVYDDIDRILPFSAFRKDHRSKDGYADWCIECEKGREEYYDYIHSGGTASTFKQLKSSTYVPNEPKKSGLCATIKSTFGFKRDN